MINLFAHHCLLEGDYDIKQIQVMDEIGRGNSHVYTALIDGELYALKQIEIKTDYEYQSFLREISYMRELCAISQDLIQYYGYFVTLQEINQYSRRKYAHIVMDCAQMNLQNLISQYSSEGRRFNKSDLIKVVEFLLGAFDHLEKNKIAHCDIKPENILVMSGKDLTIKLCDVGSCKFVDSESMLEATVLGTVPFLAPELVKTKSNKIISSNVFKSDVFSFGLVVLYLITFKKFSTKQRIEVSDPVYFEIINEWVRQAREVVNFDSRVADILRNSLEFEEHKRMLFREVKASYQNQKRKKQAAFQLKIKKLQDEQTEKRIKLEAQYFTGIPSPTRRINFFKSKNNFSKNPNRTTSIGFPKISRNYDRNYDRNASPSPLSPGLSPLLNKRQSGCFTNSPQKLNNSIIDFKKVIYVSQMQKQLIPFDYLSQEEKNFVLFLPSSQIKKADCISIYQPCPLAALLDLAETEGNKLFIQYQGFQGQGISQECPPLKFKKIFTNFRATEFKNGFRQLLNSFSAEELQYVQMDLTNSNVVFEQVVEWLDRLQGRCLRYLGLVWQNTLMTAEQHTLFVQKISKIGIKKLSLIMNQRFIKYEKESRWQLPKNCEILYLEYTNNFVGKLVPNLSLSLSNCPLKELYLNLSNNNLNKSQANILFKSISSNQTLEKLVLNLSWNPIQDISYIISSLPNLRLISSFQLKLHHASISQAQIFQAVSEVAQLFEGPLKIFKIGYDRSMQKQEFYDKIDSALKGFKGLKIDVIGNDTKYLMAFIKKLSKSSKSKAATNKVKGEKTNALGFKSIDEQKDVKQKTGVCPCFYTNNRNFDNYMCLSCSEFSEVSKGEFFCKYCIENCRHKGHNIVKIYERTKCACSYSGHCTSDLPRKLCAEELKIRHKKAYKCYKCEKRLCQACALRCQECHRGWVEETKDSTIFECRSPL